MAKGERLPRVSGIQADKKAMYSSKVDFMQAYLEGAEQEEALSQEITSKYEVARDRIRARADKAQQRTIRRRYGVAFIVRDTKNPTNYCIVFAKHKHNARSKGAKILLNDKEVFYGSPEVGETYLRLRAYRCPAFDKYYMTKQVPIKVQLKHGLKYKCAICRSKHEFSYEDLEKGYCHVVYDGYNVNPYTEGYVICNNCYRRLK